jgi:hypothetical protein
MNAAFRSRPLLTLLSGRRLRVFAVRLWRHVEEPPYYAFHAFRNLGFLFVI